MSRRKPYTLRSLGKEEAAQVNANFDRLYRSTIESTLGYDPASSATLVKAFQVEETGRWICSANGSPTVVRSFPLRSAMSDLLFATVSVRNSAAGGSASAGNASAAVTAYITDITASSVSMEVRTFSGGTTFSSVTTASLVVFWRVLASSP